MKKYGIFLAICVLTLSVFTGCGVKRRPITAPTQSVMPTVPATLAPTIPYTETIPSTTAPHRETEDQNMMDGTEGRTDQTEPQGGTKSRNRMR